MIRSLPNFSANTDPDRARRFLAWDRSELRRTQIVGRSCNVLSWHTIQKPLFGVFSFEFVFILLSLIHAPGSLMNTDGMFDRIAGLTASSQVSLSLTHSLTCTGQ